MLGNGDGTFQTHVDYAVGSEPTSVVIADFNGDGKLDLAVSNFHSNTVSILLGNGNGTFKAAVGYSTGNGPISVGVGDFNGDHKLDLVVVNETDNNVSVFLANGDGTFQPQVAYPTGVGGNPLSVTVGDFNGDHNLDLAVADFHTQQVSVLLGNGDGTFQAVHAYATGANPSAVVIGDFNGDGKLDLALSSVPLGSAPGNLVSLLLGNGDGTFAAPAIFGTGSQAYSLVVGDFNGSGTPDLAVANGVSNTVSVLLNTQGTKIAVLSSSNPSVYGQQVTFTTTVAASVSQSSAPTGTVTLKSGNKILGSGVLVAGSFSASTTSLPTGASTIYSVYSGDAHFQAHTVTVPQTVQAAGTSTALSSSANSSGEGQPVTFMATVSPSATGAPTGTVTFFDGTTLLGSSALNGNGVGGFTISTLGLGTHNITASYGGDTNFNSSTSPVLSQLVQVAQKGSSTTLLSPSSNSGELVLTATVTPGTPGAPTGTVNFMDGTTQLGSAALNVSGVASFSTWTLTAGSHHLTASYSGDANFNPSTSSTVAITADFSIANSALTPSTVTPGQSATTSITITPSDGFNSSGVTFTCSISPASSDAPACSVGSISVANGVGTATETVKTFGATSAVAQSISKTLSGRLLAFGLLIPAILLGTSGLGVQQRRKLRSFGAVVVILGGCFVQAACGGGTGTTSNGGGPTGTPAGAYTVTITGTSNGMQHSTSVTLTVN